MPIESYLQQIERKTPNKLHANWELNRVLKLGDIGKWQDQEFVPYTSLEKLNIPMEVRTGNKQKLEWSSERGVRIKPLLKAKGEAEVLDLDAEVVFEIEFEQAKTFVLSADGLQSLLIENLAEIEKGVIAAKERGDWNDDYSIVTELMVSDATTLLIAGERDVKTTFSASGKWTMEQLSLANAEVGFQVNSTKKLALESVGEPGATPLFKTKHLKRDFWSGDDQLRSRGVGNPPPSNDDDPDQMEWRLVDYGD